MTVRETMVHLFRGLARRYPNLEKELIRLSPQARRELVWLIQEHQELARRETRHKFMGFPGGGR